MKYPLTEDAKRAAEYLASTWNSGEIKQKLLVGQMSYIGGKETTVFEGAQPEFQLPDLASLLELAEFNLIRILRFSGKSQENWEILLMQELRNAVESDFEVSEYFLTMNAVGSIILGGLNIQPGGLYMSGASNVAEVHQSQSVETVADTLAQTLGRDLLQSQKALRTAIDELRDATATEKQSKIGNVITQLGNSLAHGANTATISTALMMLAQYL